MITALYVLASAVVVEVVLLTFIATLLVVGLIQRRQSLVEGFVKIEAVTVCVGYGDFLAATLPENLPLLDDLVIVTTADDEETRAVCRKYSVHHVLSDDHRRDGPFNKARMIQRGLDQIGAHDWILHVDADIVLPRKFRQFVDWAHSTSERSTAPTGAT